MRILFIPLIALLQFHLAGCAGNMPMTPQEFRPTVEKESFEVNRPYPGVTETFERMAVKCLDVTKTVSSPGNPQLVINWNPTFIATRDKAEFHLQRVYEKGVEQKLKEPARGHFVIVADIVPASIRKTRIEIYRSMDVPLLILKAVRNWATGKDIGCPDMTKT